MPGDEKPPKRLRGVLGIALSLASLAVLVFIAVMLITGRGDVFRRIGGFFFSRKAAEEVDEYYFETGRSRVFANLDGYVASAGTLGIQVFDSGGNETLRESFRMESPAIDAANGRALAFDVGGTALRAFSAEEVTASIETDSLIVSASINENGWFCVCIQNDGGYKGVVTAYNNLGKEVYKLRVASGYVLSAVLSPDNKMMAVLTLVDGGSRIAYYDLSSTTPAGSYDFYNGLILEIFYLPGGDLFAVASESLIIIDKRYAGTEIYSFTGRRLGGYSVNSGVVALYLLDFGVGYGGRLVTLDGDGQLLGVLATDSEIVSISSCEGYLAVLKSDMAILYDSGLYEIPREETPAVISGANHILGLGGGAALAAGDHSAVVIRSGENYGTSN